MEGPQPIKPEQVGPTPIHPALIELPHTIACSVTGGYVYRGKKFPELRGAYVFGDWETRRLWAARFEGDRTKEMPEIARPSVRIVAFGEDNDGELYFLDHDGGTLHTLERNDAAPQNADFPTKLSQTGLFASVKDHTPAAGVVPFAVNSRQWQDGATAEHWVAFPGDVVRHAARDRPSRSPAWCTGTTSACTSPRTRCWCGRSRWAAGGWRRSSCTTTAWTGAPTRTPGATIRPTPTWSPPTAPRRKCAIGKQKRVWQFHSRSQCMSCHSNQSEYALAFQPEQLNRPGPDGRNQLVALTRGGLHPPGRQRRQAAAAVRRRLGRARNESSPTRPTTSQPLEARARAYLHANCGHCHSDHGGGAVAAAPAVPRRRSPR